MPNMPHFVSLWSRRAFVRGALVGTTGALLRTPQGYAAEAVIGPHVEHTQQNSSRNRRGAPSSTATWSLSEASRLVRDKKVSPVELAQECLRRIEPLNKPLPAVVRTPAVSTRLACHRSYKAQGEALGTQNKLFEGEKQLMRYERDIEKLKSYKRELEAVVAELRELEIAPYSKKPAKVLPFPPKKPSRSA